MVDIRKIRQDASLSQARFAEITGISQYRLSEIELFKASPTPDELSRISNTAAAVLNGSIKVRKGKRISKKSFESSIIQTHPRRSYDITPRNAEYLRTLSALEQHFRAPRPQAPVVVSFFTGCGGMCYGLKAAGFNIVAANELVEAYKDIYRLNFGDIPFLSNNICDVTDEEIRQLMDQYGEIDIMAGGPPCQGFSLAGKRDISDKRNTLFEYYLQIASKIRPKIILMENVRLLTSMKAPDGTLVKDKIISTFQSIGYTGTFHIVNAADYSVPQNRERVFFIGVRNDLDVPPVSLTPTCSDSSGLFASLPPCFTFGDAVSDLEFLESGECSADDSLHKATRHPEHVIRWLYDVPQGRSAHDNAESDMRPPSGYNTTYKRQVWSRPGCTVTTNFTMISGCNNVHPIATRAITVREALRLQSFPDSFRFTGSSETIRTVIGNAVPPLLAYHIARQLIEHYNLANA